MSPLEITIILHYYCHSTSWPWITGGTDACINTDIQAKLLNDGWLVVTESVYAEDETLPSKMPDFTPTAKLNAYCEALKQVKEPVQKWVVE